MALSNESITRQNQWWVNSGWDRDDLHLKALARQPVSLTAELVDTVDLAGPAIHIVRGPRQVGKSTDLKLIVKRAIELGTPARKIVYLTLDLLEGEPLQELVKTIIRARALSKHQGPSILLLDEVTVVDRWQMAIKALWDDGTIAEDVVICTGSSAIDLQRGSIERLPGRRGGGRDYAVFPQSFSSFARAVHSHIPSSPNLSLEGITSNDGWSLCEQMQVYMPQLADAFERYLVFGGLPAAVAEAVQNSVEPSQETKRVIFDSMLKEIQRTRASRMTAHALLERVVRSLGSKTSWARMAREIGEPLSKAPSRLTVQSYVEFLAAAYFILTLYFWKRETGSSEISKDKKLYFGDLLLHTVAREYAPGLPVNKPALAENAVALALFRRYEPEYSRTEGFNGPALLHVWQTRRMGEVDFVCGPYNKVSALEVKYRNTIDLRSVAAIRKVFPGRPVVVATKERLERHDGYSLVPVPMLLWLLG